MSGTLKFLPTDFQEGVDRFIRYMATDYYRDYARDYPTDKAQIAVQIEGRIKGFELEIRRETAHLWFGNGSVAWFVLGDNLVIQSKPNHHRLCKCVACTMQRPYFKRGDVLKSASWKGPAKNFARGNVLTTTDWAAMKWKWNGVG